MDENIQNSSESTLWLERHEFLVIVFFIILSAVYVVSSYASTASNFTNNNAAVGSFKASASNIPVLDITIPDTWNGGSYVDDIEKKAGSAAYWQGDTLNSFTALGATSGVGYKDDATIGFQGTEPVVIDQDGDGVYTTAADVLIDADGATTSGAGTDNTVTGVELLPMSHNITSGGSSVCTNSISSPTIVRVDSGGGCTNGGSNTGTYLIGASASFANIEADYTWGFYDSNNNSLFDAGEALFKVNLAHTLKTSATLLDGNGATAGAGTGSGVVGTSIITPLSQGIGTSGGSICVDSLSSPANVKLGSNNQGSCSGGGTYIIGSTGATIVLKGSYSFVDANANGTYDIGESIYRQSVAGTYSGSGDIDVYSTGGLTLGDALRDFALDCDGAGVGTKRCKYTGSGTITSASSILIDEGTTSGAAPNSVVDKKADKLLGLGVQNTGTAINGTDIQSVKAWVENGSTTGFQSNEDTLLGSMTVNSGNTKEWRLGSLTQAVPAGGKRIYITVDLTSSPTHGSTLNFKLPVYSDALSDGIVSSNNDVGVFFASNNDGPTNSAITNANTETIDTSRPTVTLSTATTSPFNSSTFSVTATFSESVTGFTVDDISVVNGSKSNFSGSGTTYTFDITPSGQGAVTVNVADTSAQDAAGNTNTAASELSRTYDTVRPALTLASSSAGSYTNSSPINVTATFSESVTGFTSDDISLGNNATIGTFSGSGTSYSFTVVPSAEGLITINVAQGIAQDTASNTNTVASQISATYDTTAPSITSITSSASDPTDTSPIPIHVVFSESVTGFSSSDMSVTNGTAGTVSGSGDTYTFNVTPRVNGSVQMSIPINSVADTAGNLNDTTGQFSITFSSLKPTVAIESSEMDITHLASIPIVVTFSASVISASDIPLSASDFSTSGFTISNFSATDANEGGYASRYTFNMIPDLDGTKTLGVNADVAKDAGGHTNFSSSFSIVYDGTPPEITSASTIDTPLNSTFFSYSINASEYGTIAFGGGCHSSSETVNTGANNITIDSLTDGTYDCTIVVTDAAGNPSTTFDMPEFRVDRTSPTVALSSTSDTTLNHSFSVTATFNEDVTDAAADMITITNGSLSNFESLSDAVVTFTVTPSTDGDVTVHISENKAHDVANNGNSASDTLTRTYDHTAPVLTPGADITSPTADTTPSYSFDSDSVGVISYAGGCMGAADAIADTNNLTFTALVQGTYNCTITVTDAVGNSSSIVLSTFVIDTTPPDTSLPVISSVVVTLSAHSASFTWTTNEIASSKVSYGLSQDGYSRATSETNITPRVLSHSVALNNTLVSCTTYKYKLSSKDAVPNEGVYEDYFTTKGCAGGANANVHAKTASSVSHTFGGDISLVSDTSTASISAPASYADANLEFQVKKLDINTQDLVDVVGSTGMPGNLVAAAASIYDLHSLSDTETAVTMFAEDTPISVMLPYTESDIAGLDESTLKIARYDEGTGWTTLSSCVVNTSAKTVTCDTDGFSTFAIFGETTPESPIVDTGNETPPVTNPILSHNFSTHFMLTANSPTPSVYTSNPILARGETATTPSRFTGGIAANNISTSLDNHQGTLIQKLTPSAITSEIGYSNSRPVLSTYKAPSSQRSNKGFVWIFSIILVLIYLGDKAYTKIEALLIKKAPIGPQVQF